MKRSDKIKQIETFFRTGEIRQEIKIVFEIRINGKLFEPFQDEQKMKEYIEVLKKEYNQVIVWKEDKSYL